MKHYNVHSDDSVDEDEDYCHGNGDDGWMFDDHCRGPIRV